MWGLKRRRGREEMKIQIKKKKLEKNTKLAFFSLSLFLSPPFLIFPLPDLEVRAMLMASGVPSAGGARIAAGSGSRRRESGRRSDGVNGRSTMAVPSTSTSSGNNGDAGKKKKTVIGLGSCGLDYLALVAAFPKPDDKLRTEKMEVIFFPPEFFSSFVLLLVSSRPLKEKLKKKTRNTKKNFLKKTAARRRQLRQRPHRRGPPGKRPTFHRLARRKRRRGRGDF